MTAPAPVELTRVRGVATLTVRGAKRLNVLGSETLTALIAAGERLRAEPDLRLVLVTGEGERAFIGGADIDEMAGLAPDTAREFITRVHQANHTFRALPVPSIALIRGYCLGAGMELAAACDLRLGSEDSTYGMPEVQVGLPSVVEAGLLPSLIGWGKTRELLYTGSLIDAAEAERIGFLQKVAPGDRLREAAEPWIEAILAADPAAIRTQKRLIESWLDSGIGAGILNSIDAFAATYQSDAPKRRMEEWRARQRERKKSP
ncbi:MAG: enoyl-CoA hydratase-related protein [SAR324 cluster bacterium]|nr:enoyl-CoA hydratase-related protein [SAR324 cluster bacterium]